VTPPNGHRAPPGVLEQDDAEIADAGMFVADGGPFEFPEPRSPHLEVLHYALEELHRVVVAINVDHVLGRPVAPALTLVIEPGTPNLALAIAGDLDGLELARLQELLGQNLDLRYRNGRLEVHCPSVEALNRDREA
jgi:hypothetical protein